MSMECVVVKIGAAMFDAAHAYGLGIFLAYASQSVVELVDEGHQFRLKFEGITRRFEMGTCIRSLLALPSVDELRSYRESPQYLHPTVCNLDGVLAILFTSRGIRVLSVRDVFYKEQLNDQALEQSLAKTILAIERWVKQIELITNRQSDWLEHLLSTYVAYQPVAPIPIVKLKHMISIPMTIDPTFSFSTRRPTSDGRIDDKVNVSFSSTPYAPILAIIGATRFLRAQRVAPDLALFYLPIAASITILHNTTLPVLNSSIQFADQTVAWHWLDRGWEQAVLGARWAALAYQSMQTQGPQQSISRSCGCLDYLGLERLTRCAGSAIVYHWRNLIRSDQRELPFDLDPLLDVLLHRRPVSWIRHLREVAQQVYREQGVWPRLYSLTEVKGMITAMSIPRTSPLRAVLERKQGTLRFGHALRLLGHYNSASLRDLIDALDAIRSSDALIRILAQRVQECQVASAKSKYIIVPDDDDLAYLLDDIEQYGAQTVAGLLVILSTLDYPRTNSQERGMKDTANAEE